MGRSLVLLLGLGAVMVFGLPQDPAGWVNSGFFVGLVIIVLVWMFLRVIIALVLFVIGLAILAYLVHAGGAQIWQLLVAIGGVLVTGFLSFSGISND